MSSEVYRDVEYRNKITETCYRYLVVPKSTEIERDLEAYLNRVGFHGWQLVARNDSEMILCKLTRVEGSMSSMETHSI